MARSLVESLADRFDPDAYTDTYRAALETLIEQRMRGEKRNAKRRRPEPKVIDLMEALKASVDEATGGARAKAGATKRSTGAKRRATRPTGRRTKRSAA